MIGYLDEDIRALVLIMPKTSGYVKILKVEDKNNELMFFYIVYEKIFATFDFFNHGFDFQNYVWNGCHDLTMIWWYCNYHC